MANRLPLLVNGRFLSRPPTGVDRLALELIRAIAREAGDGISMTLAVPTNVTDAMIATLADVPFAAVRRGRMSGQLWEQIELRGLDPCTPLLSLANMGSLLRRNQLIFIDDAQVFLAPQSFSPAFRTWYRIAHPTLGRVARWVCTISQFSLDQLHRFHVVPPSKGTVVHLAADHISGIAPDPDALVRHGLTAGGYLLATGNLAPHKNLAMLMRAAGARPPGAPELIIAGGIDKRVFQHAGLAPPAGVRLIGRVSDAELKALYLGARLFAFPSLTEGFGLPPLEAMTCGCPVIATTAGAVPEICGDAALFVDPLDEAGWTAALVALANDDAVRAHLAARGRAQAAQFGWRFAARIVLNLLRGGDPACHS